MKNEVGKIYECFGTFVLCTGNVQVFGMVGQTFQGVVIKTDGIEEAFVGQFSDTWSSGQFKETNKKIKLKNIND